MIPKRFGAVADLLDPARLSDLLGPVEDVMAPPLSTVGFSGSQHFRLRCRLEGGRTRDLVLKRTPLARDWTVALSGDTQGREVSLIESPRLAPLWQIFRMPYLAYSAEPGEIGLLMPDFTERLFPDAREPLSERDEDALLGALAHMHARFWKSPALELPWLGDTARHLALLGPARRNDAAALALFPPPLQQGMTKGWPLALAALPPRVAAFLDRPAAELAASWSTLPRTLFHGDVKVANFVVLGDGAITAFDWATVGAGPCSIDLGWYLAVNATRLAHGKEAAVARYRELLERRLGRSLPAAEWAALETAAIAAGAVLLLWSKALARDAGRPGAREEWDWWVGRLEAIV